MRITYDHQIFGLNKYGGIARYFSELANHIERSGNHEVQVFAPLYVNEYLSARRSVVRGKHVSGGSKFGRLMAWPVNTAISYATMRRRRDVDIFHETYYSPIDCRPRFAKRVVTVYDMIQEKYPEFFSRKTSIGRYKAMAVERADHVICISEQTRRDLLELLKIPERKTSVVYLGYDLAAGRTYSSPVPQKSFILYVGNRGGYKNFVTLLRAYASSPTLKEKVSLVCFGGGAFTVREQKEITALALDPHKVVQISGDDNVLAALYRSAAAFVYPSKYEGFGIPTLEAMSFGCPVICSNTSSLPEVVGEAAELIDPDDEIGLRGAMEKLLSSKTLADTLIQRGYNRIKKFSWAKCARDTLDVYSMVLSK